MCLSMVEVLGPRGGACSQGCWSGGLVWGVPGPRGCLVLGDAWSRGETATAADGTHPTRMHSCYCLDLLRFHWMNSSNSSNLILFLTKIKKTPLFKFLFMKNKIIFIFWKWIKCRKVYVVRISNTTSIASTALVDLWLVNLYVINTFYVLICRASTQ